MARGPRGNSRAAIIKRIHDLLDQQEPLVQQAFLDSIERIKSDALLQQLVELIARGDIGGAIRALNIEPLAYQALDRALTNAYGAGGGITADNLPALIDRSGARVVIRFNVRNQRAEAWARDYVGSLIRGISQDQVLSVRQTIEAGLAAGRNPRSTALDLIGRINRATGRREGGVIGLTSRYTETVNKARQSLLTGDKDGMRAYLELGRRDKRFDRSVLRALEDGRGLSADMAERATGRLADSYLQLRGQTIAQTETLTSVNAARREAFRQGLDATGYTEQDTEREWSSAGDGKVRDTHRAMDGQKVRGLEARYQSPSGAQLLHPGDPSAPAAERIGCRCVEIIRIRYFGGELVG